MGQGVLQGPRPVLAGKVTLDQDLASLCLSFPFCTRRMTTWKSFWGRQRIMWVTCSARASSWATFRAAGGTTPAAEQTHPRARPCVHGVAALRAGGLAALPRVECSRGRSGWGPVWAWGLGSRAHSGDRPAGAMRRGPGGRGEAPSGPVPPQTERHQPPPPRCQAAASLGSRVSSTEKIAPCPCGVRAGLQGPQWRARVRAERWRPECEPARLSGSGLRGGSHRPRGLRRQAGPALSSHPGPASGAAAGWVPRGERPETRGRTAGWFVREATDPDCDGRTPRNAPTARRCPWRLSPAGPAELGMRRGLPCPCPVEGQHSQAGDTRGTAPLGHKVLEPASLTGT